VKLTVVHIGGARDGNRRSFADERSIRLGRAPDNDLVFDRPEDGLVSGSHAEIRVEGDSVEIVDLGSTNGTWVAGERIESRRLEPSDTVRLGRDGPAIRVELAAVEKRPPGEKKYGQRTVGMLIQQALAQAGLGRVSGTSKSTEYFEALVDRKLRSTSSRLKWIVLAAVSLTVIGIAITAWYIWQKPSAVNVIQQVSYSDAAGGNIAARNRYAVFLLAGSPVPDPLGSAQLDGYCTAFAVGPDLLATNAHCALAGRRHFGSVWALMNGVPNARYRIVQSVAHPGYQEGRLSPDVGLVRVAARLQHTCSIAPPSQLSHVAPGVQVFLYGFPGRLNREDAPEATFVKGDIGRVTGFDQKLGDFGRNTLLQHSAFSSGGTSGSPIFDSAGYVIGINAGGYVENGQALAGYNFGMRIDLLKPLFSSIGARYPQPG
jgi:hypothetical protein